MDNLVFANGAPPGRLNFQGCTPGYPASLSCSVSNWSTDSVFSGKSGPVWIGISGPVYSGMTGPVCSGTGGPLCSGIGGRMPPESAIFERLKNELISDLPISEIAACFGDRRLEEEAERRAMLQQAKALDCNDAFADCHAFFEAVIDYFQETPFSGGNTPSNMFLHSLRAVVDECTLVQPPKPSGHDARRSLLMATDQTLKQLRRNWERLSTEYAKALAASLE